MRIVSKSEMKSIATVYIAEMENGHPIEFVESVQPPFPREDKWVLIVSTLYGCPVQCPLCDAGIYYKGKLSYQAILEQIDYMVMRRYPDRRLPMDKFKIQFARMGDPAFNTGVLDVLEILPQKYDAPGLMPSISTVSPAGCEPFFHRLIDIKNDLYGPRFQMQFSIHSTDAKARDWMVPVRKWDFNTIADFVKDFYVEGDRKVTLNFALAEGMTLDPDVLLRYFSPDQFLIKVTPVNPTFKATQNRIVSHVRPDQESYPIIDRLQEAGYDVLLSIGEWAENDIGSNCGQMITHYLEAQKPVPEGYTVPLQTVSNIL